MKHLSMEPVVLCKGQSMLCTYSKAASQTPSPLKNNVHMRTIHHSSGKGYDDWHMDSLTVLLQFTITAQTFLTYSKLLCVYVCKHTYMHAHMHTIPFPTLPYRTLPCPALPYPIVPCPALPCHAMPYHAIPYHTRPYHTIQ